MKIDIIISSFLLVMVSCHSSIDDSPLLLNKPVEEVKLTVSEETFTVDFSFDSNIKERLEANVFPETFAKLKTRNDLINYYKTLTPLFQKSYSSMIDNNENVFVKVEYMLAQECFDDRCDSKTRKDILSLAATYQKDKYELYTFPSSTQRTGVFLMAVILVKERNRSINFIDASTLQQALVCLNNNNFVNEYFSDLIIESSEKFLTDNKN